MTLGVLLACALLGIFVLIVLPVFIYWRIASEIRWPAHIRDVLAREGFTVRHLERRWFTRGPFPDMRLPGTKGSMEWLIRFVAEGRDHQGRGGWIRWRRRLPWQTADRWAIHWDTLPASGVWDGAAAAESKGLSSRVFYTLLLGMGAVIVMVVLTIWRSFDFGFQIRTAAAQEPSVAARANIPLCPVLQVVKITTGCEDPTRSLDAGGRGTNPPAGGGPGDGPGTGAGSGAAALEESLAKTGRADVYSIYFAFNSDEIREESESTLREIAEVLRRHPEWKLVIEGHTDNIATDAYNLQLSQRRAAAVKQALVSGKGVAGARLTTGGFGEARPKDTNDTLEGRARNRRVELVRVP